MELKELWTARGGQLFFPETSEPSKEDGLNEPTKPACTFPEQA